MMAAEEGLVLVARGGGATGLPTACPACLPVYCYLKLAAAQFDLHYDTANPDSDHIPYVESGDYVAFNNEKGGAIQCLKEDGIVDLDSKLPGHVFPHWVSMKAMVTSWLSDAALFELWVTPDNRATAEKIFLSDLPWPIGKILHWRQSRAVKELLGITNNNCIDKEVEIFQKASLAYEALSVTLGEQSFFFENRPTSVDAVFLGHALFVLYALPDTSVLRSNLLKHDNLVKYTENHKIEILNGSSSASSVPRAPLDASSPSSSSTPRRRTSTRWSSKAKPKAKKEKTEEEKTFRRRAKYFLAAQAVAVLVFLSLMGGAEGPEYEDGEEDGISYEE